MSPTYGGDPQFKKLTGSVNLREGCFLLPVMGSSAALSLTGTTESRNDMEQTGWLNLGDFQAESNQC